MTKETQQPDELLACPFCAAELFEPTSVQYPKLGLARLHPGSVEDNSCPLSGWGFYDHQLTAWNTRTPPTDSTTVSPGSGLAEWQDIASAPKDGTVIVLNSDSPLWRYPFVGFWNASLGWWDFSDPNLSGCFAVSELVNLWCPIPGQQPSPTAGEPVDRDAVWLAHAHLNAIEEPLRHQDDRGNPFLSYTAQHVIDAFKAGAALKSTPPKAVEPTAGHQGVSREVVEALAHKVLGEWLLPFEESTADRRFNAGLRTGVEAMRAALSLPIAPTAAPAPGVVEALRKCRDKFRHYEDLHLLKCTSEGDEKADRNREMADMCDAALDTSPTSNGGGA